MMLNIHLQALEFALSSNLQDPAVKSRAEGQSVIACAVHALGQRLLSVRFGWLPWPDRQNGRSHQ